MISKKFWTAAIFLAPLILFALCAFFKLGDSWLERGPMAYLFGRGFSYLYFGWYLPFIPSFLALLKGPFTRKQQSVAMIAIIIAGPWYLMAALIAGYFASGNFTV